jgi:hypothetical protein
VVAIVTKFDSFAQDVQQEMEEAAEEEQREVDEDEVEKEAFVEAMARFEQHYKQRLEHLPFPPKAVVTLSNGKMSLSSSPLLLLTLLKIVHMSTPDDSRLARLILETMNALTVPEADPQGPRNVYDFSTFFSITQYGDTKTKLTVSALWVTFYGLLCELIGREGFLETG